MCSTHAVQCYMTVIMVCKMTVTMLNALSDAWTNEEGTLVQHVGSKVQSCLWQPATTGNPAQFIAPAVACESLNSHAATAYTILPGCFHDN